MIKIKDVQDVLKLKLISKTVNTLFFLVIATLPWVHKVSRIMAVLYLILFFKYIYTYKDFILPYAHRIFVLSLFGLIFISNILAGTMLTNFRKDFYLMVFILLFYATIYFRQKNLLHISTLVYAIVISMTIYMVDGYFQYFVGFDLFFNNQLTSGGINAISQNRNIFSLAALFYFIVLLYLYIEKKEKSLWILTLLYLSFTLIILTLSRQIWLATLMTLLIILIFKFRVVSMKFFLLSLVFLMIIGFVVWQIPEIYQRFISLQEGYSSGRIDLWKVLIYKFYEAPIFGHSLQPSLPFDILGGKYTYAHNLTIDILYSFGLSGFVLYVLFVIHFLKILWKCQDETLKPYFIGLFIALIFVQQQLGASLLIHKFVGPTIMIFLAIASSSCSSLSFIKNKNSS